MIDFAAIIEREWRKAVNDQTSPVHVELIADEELIRITYRCATYECDCTDDDFVFVRQDGLIVRFPVPDDYLG